jgi:hypothetical protein
MQAGIVAIAYTRLLLGTWAMLGRDAPASSWPYAATVAVVVALALALAHALRDSDFSSAALAGRKVVEWANPCRTDTKTLQALQANLDKELEGTRQGERARIAGRVQEVTDNLYAEVGKGVDDYLDWYFTVIAEYERLLALGSGRFAEKMRGELEQRIFGEQFARRLDDASAALATESRARLAGLAARIGGQVREEAGRRPCWTGRIDFAALGELERDALRATTAAGGGAAAGLVTARILARRAAAAAATKASSKRVFQGAASLGGRQVAKRGGTAVVAAVGLGATCGPLAPLCALAVGAVTWITVDKAFIEIDELRFRDEMRREILEAVAEQKAALEQALTLQHQAAIDQGIDGIDRSVQRMFVPARQGL